MKYQSYSSLHNWLMLWSCAHCDTPFRVSRSNLVFLSNLSSPGIVIQTSPLHYYGYFVCIFVSLMINSWLWWRFPVNSVIELPFSDADLLALLCSICPLDQELRSSKTCYFSQFVGSQVSTDAGWKLYEANKVLSNNTQSKISRILFIRTIGKQSRNCDYLFKFILVAVYIA